MKHILARVSGLILLFSMILTPLAAGATGIPDLSLVSLTIDSETAIPQVFALTSFSLKGHYANGDPAAKLADAKAAEDLSKSLQDFVLVSFIIPGGEYNTIGASSTDASLQSGDDFEFRYIGFFTSTGSKKLTFTIDSQNSLAESNEANNTLTQDVIVAPLDPLYQTLPITDISASEISKESVVLSWKTADPTQSLLFYWPDKVGAVAEVAGLDLDSLSVLTTSNSLFIPNLSANTDYKYLIMAGNTNTTGVSAVQNFRTNNQEMSPIPDSEKIIFSDIKTTIKNSYSATVTWKTNIPTASKVSYRPTKPCVSNFLCDMDRAQTSKDLTIDHSVILPLYPADTYTYHIEAQLNLSKPIQKSVTLTVVTTDPVIDVTPLPVIEPDPIGDVDPNMISDVKVDQITSNSAVISWTTSRAVYSDLDYNVTPCFETEGCLFSARQVLGDTASTNHQVTLTDLKPSTDYQYNFSTRETTDRSIGNIYVRAYYFKTSFGPVPIELNNQKEIVERSKVRNGVLDREKNRLAKTDSSLVNKLRGRLLLQIEEKGEAWYVDPVGGRRFYMQDGVGAYEALRSFGLGISNKDLEQIPVGVLWDDILKGDIDSDHDGLADKLESALGTDPYNIDSDNDSYTDGQEVRNGYSPLGSPKVKVNAALVKKLAGRILIQADHKGEAWYINPVDGHRYFLGNGDQAYQLMRKLALGISNSNLNKLPVGN